jgi:homoserine O-succinyltransferase
MSRAAQPLPGAGAGGGADSAIVVGLVNNMPDAALQATEQQFRALLGAAAAGRRVELRLIALPEVPRGPAGARRVQRHYAGPEILRREPLDALIVTGTEPRQADLQDEPYWDALAELVDWSQRHTASVIWSCLAAHAAVLRLDGIPRRRFQEKLFGLFACPARGGHALAQGLGVQRRVPHSRFNDLPEEALEQAGYRILARADGVGADLFVRDGESLFVFLQGHPEYDALALAREYRRDVGRFLGGERATMPGAPKDYFGEPALERLRQLEQEALQRCDPALLERFAPVERDCAPCEAWRGDAVRLYGNWLSCIEERRGRPRAGAVGAPREMPSGSARRDAPGGATRAGGSPS